MMTRTLLPIGLLVGLTTSGLFAQVKPATILPAEPILTLHIDGPAALRGAFLPTNMGRMFAGPEFQDMIAPVKQMIASLKGQAGGELPFDVDTLEESFYGYGGRISAAFHLLDETVDFTSGEPPAFAVTVVLTPDGKTDLTAFCESAHKVLDDKLGEALRSMDVAGTTISYFVDDDSDEPGFCAPFMHEDNAVFLITKDFKRAAAAVLAEDAQHHTREKAFTSASIGASVNVKKIMRLLAAAGKEKGGANWQNFGQQILKGSGLFSIDSLDLTYRAKGPAVLSEAVLSFNQENRGVIGAFFQAQAARSALIDMLPRNATSASAMPFDLKQVYKAVKATFADIGDAAPQSFDELEEDFKDHFGLRLYEDLVGLFGQNIMSIQTAVEDVDTSNPLGPLDGMCLAFDVSDGKRLEKTIDTMLRKDGLHAGRKKDNYKGFKVYNLTVAMMLEVSYAVSDNLLLIGLGNAGGDGVRAGLDAVQSRAAAKEVPPLPAGVAARLQMTRGGYTGLGWADVRFQTEKASAQLDAVAGTLPPQFDMLIDMLDKFPALFKAYKLETQVSVIRSAGNRWVFESIW